MSISLSRYVNIQSQVGAGTTVPNKLLIGRLFTSNAVLPTNVFIQFSNAADVGTYFGNTSEEYYRAVFYFSWISKNLTTAPAIQFASWVSVASAPQIYSIPNQVQSLTAWNSVTTGSFGLTIGADTNVFTALDFSGAADLDAVAGVIQTAIQTGVGTQWTSATVTYANNGFYFQGGDAVNAAITVIGGVTGQNIAGVNFLGWLPATTLNNSVYSSAIYLNNAKWSNGSAVVSITDTLNASQAISNNFGSFLFLNNLSLNLSQVQEAAAWNSAGPQNNDYLYTVPVIAANVSSWSSGLSSYGGLALTLTQSNVVQTAIVTNASKAVTGLSNALSVLQVGMPVSGTDIATGSVIASIVDNNNILLSLNATGSATVSLTFVTNQYPEQAPMMIEAATNYNATNAVQNYMFQTFDPYLLPLVIDDSTANAYDILSLNYYGQTQKSGTVYNFYQRGLLQGTSLNPLDQNTYVNEIWLKDAIAGVLIQLLLNLTQLPANSQGRALALLTIQGVINQALLNGVISVGKTLSTAQITFITAITNDDNAWYQVQNSGYWIDCIIEPIPDSSPIQYQAAYTLVYSKNDVIRLVSGQDILI